MKSLLLTSSGVTNQTINDALVAQLGKPIGECSALFVPTGIYPFDTGPVNAYEAITGARGHLAGLGWRSLGVLELTALPGIRRDRWVPRLEQTDALLVWGGDPMFICAGMRRSGLADLLPSLDRLVYVGVSAGSIAMTPYNFDAEFNRGNVPEGDDRAEVFGDRALGFVDFTLVPHFEHPDMDDASAAEVERWAAGVPVPTYGIDDQTAISVVGDTVEVVSEGQWRLFGPTG